METIKNLKKLYKAFGNWHEVSRELGITYQYLCALRTGKKPGKFLEKSIANTVHLLGL